MSPQTATEITNATHALYDRIAEHFAITREKVWPEGALIAQEFPRGSRVLDIGCGSGRLFPLLAARHINYFGADYSEHSIALCRTQYSLHGAQFVTGEITQIPCKDQYFDGVAALAVLHHVPSKELRVRAASECFRVLKPGGVFVITVWNLRAEYFRKHFRLTDDSFERPMYGLDPGDLMVPWKNPAGEVIGRRFVHCFTKEELVALLESAGFQIERALYMKQGKRSTAEYGTNIFISCTRI